MLDPFITCAMGDTEEDFVACEFRYLDRFCCCCGCDGPEDLTSSFDVVGDGCMMRDDKTLVCCDNLCCVDCGDASSDRASVYEPDG